MAVPLPPSSAAPPGDPSARTPPGRASRILPEPLWRPPAVSVITVCRNAADTIEATLRSVLAQRGVRLEYIVLDGASTDGTQDCIAPYLPRIAHYESAADGGLYEALNKGIALARAPIVALLHGDDLYAHEGVLQAVAATLDSTGADALYGDLVYVDREDVSQVRRYWRAGLYRPGAFRWGWMPPHPAFFVRRQVYERHGAFDTRLRSAADYELMLRLIHRWGISLAYLPQVLVRMRMGGTSNQSVDHRLRARGEDARAWALNGLTLPTATLNLKPLRKLPQFWQRPPGGLPLWEPVE